MTDLEKKYRAAPRQHSPARLDDLILSRAARHGLQKTPNRSSLMPPWKVLAVSLSVAGLGVALVFKTGLSPLTVSSDFDRASMTDQSVVVSDASDSAGVLPDNSAEAEFAPPVVVVDRRYRTTASAMAPAELSADEEAPALSLSAEPMQIADAGSDVVNPAPMTELASVDTEISITPRLSGSQVSAADAGATPIVNAESDSLMSAQSAGISAQMPKSAKRSAGEPDTSIQTRRSGEGAVQWLAKQSKNHFTIQLATATDSEFLVRFGELIDIPGRWYVVETGSLPQAEFSLLFGVFDTHDSARAQLELLTQMTTRYKPAIRSFAQLRGEP